MTRKRGDGQGQRWYGRSIHRGRSLCGSLGIVLCAVLAVSSCRHFDAKAPVGFAYYDDSTLGLPAPEFRAISADGVRFRVRTVGNEPRGDAALWTAALRRSLERKGYRLSDTASVRTEDGHDLAVVRGVIGLGGIDYGYVIGFHVTGSSVVLAEAGGSQEAVAFRTKEIDAAFRAVKIP